MKKFAAPGLENRLTAVGTRCADHVTPLYPQKLALTSPTGGGRSVCIVRARTKATEFSFMVMIDPILNSLSSYWWNHLISPIKVTTAPIAPVRGHVTQNAYKSPPLIHILSQLYLVHAIHLTSLRSTLILYSHLSLGFSKGFLPSSFSIYIHHAFLFSYMHATWRAHFPHSMEYSKASIG